MSLDPSEDKKKENTVLDEKLFEAPNISAALGALCFSEKFADVHFVVGQGKDQRVIPGHKIILASASEFFEAMLYPTKFPGDPDVKESKESKELEDEGESLDAPDLPEIEIPDVKPSVFKIMLQCLYSDRADITAEDLEAVMEVAKKFQVESLQQLCLHWMHTGVTAENACQLLIKGDFGVDEKHFALTFIEENIEEVIGTPGWDDLPQDKLITILRSDGLTIEEQDLFKACLRWALSECKRQNVEPTIENRNRVMKPIIPHIRFGNMTMEDVATIVHASGVLDTPQILPLFTYLGSEKKETVKIDFNTKKRAGAKDKWSIDPVLISPTVQLTNKNMTARNTGPSHSYCQGTLEFTSGKHAWRVNRDTAPSAWLMLGVSRKQAHQNQSYSQSTVWGMSSANQQYIAGSASHFACNLTAGPIDVMLDCDAGTLTVVNLANGQNHLLTGIPRNSPLVPHFGPHSNQQLTIRVISQRDFGKSSS
jgi:hypothetical protein